MIEKIYTIPINEAFDTPIDCPFCKLLSDIENNQLHMTLGAAMMEPDRRQETNQFGFCKEHITRLLEMNNKLSLSLVLKTRYDWIINQLAQHSKSINSIGEKKKNIFKKATDAKKTISDLSDKLSKINQSCVICEKTNTSMLRFLDVFFCLWQKEKEFKEKVERTKGFCLIHYKMLLDYALKHLSTEKLINFSQMLYDKQLKSLENAQNNLHRFSLKFDYRNADMEWKDAKDALFSSSKRLHGTIRIKE